ncbi:hypothetical protein TNCV_2916061 [Trichonephila clavipes]|nr:hypothetical protein TNCV_2916061 [Trichonephila clavipes]
MSSERVSIKVVFHVQSFFERVTVLKNFSTDCTRQSCHLQKGADKERVFSDSSEILSLLPTEPIKEARKNTRGAKEQRDRQSTAEQPQKMKPQHGSLRRRSGG